MAKTAKNRLQPNKQRIAAFFALLCAATLISAGLYQYSQRFKATHGAPAVPHANKTVTSDAAEPDERKPDTGAYSVPAGDPKFIRLSSLDITGPIQKVGLTKTQAIAAPTNVNFAGWYTGSEKPGNPGLSIIDGHVSGKYSDGIFKKLATLKAGDNFEIVFGDDSVRHFSVVETARVKVSEATTKLLAKKAGVERQLNLITCGGRYDKTSQSYDERIIVVAQSKY